MGILVNNWSPMVTYGTFRPLRVIDSRYVIYRVWAKRDQSVQGDHNKQ